MRLNHGTPLVHLEFGYVPQPLLGTQPKSPRPGEMLPKQLHPVMCLTAQPGRMDTKPPGTSKICPVC